jgi:hypothetical protein
LLPLAAVEALFKSVVCAILPLLSDIWRLRRSERPAAVGLWRSLKEEALKEK